MNTQSSIQPTTVTDIGQLLSRLSRKGAFLEPERMSPGKFRVLIPGEIHSGRPKWLAAADLVQTARASGWLQAEPRGRRLRLTEAGMLALRSGATHVAAPPHSTRPASPPSARPDKTTPLQRLRKQRDGKGRPIVSGAEAEAGLRLANDFQIGQLRQRVTQNWDQLALGYRHRASSPLAAAEVADGVSAAEERFRRVIAACPSNLSAILLDVCCLETGLEAVERGRGWPAGSARIVLQTALEWLSSYYGTIDEAVARPGTRQWGSEDYKPTLDRWRGM
jgi:hypothetical protein